MPNCKPKKAVIYDFDGTLIDSAFEIYKGVSNVLKMSGCQNKPSFEEFCNTFSAPYMDYYQKMGVKATEEKIVRWYYQVANTNNRPWFSDVKDVLHRVSNMGYQQSIISAHPAKHVLERCEQFKIDSIIQRVIGDAHRKVQALKSIYCLFSIPAKNMYYIGDFVSDVRDAKEAGVVSVGITRGRNTKRALIKNGAQFCIDTLEELPEILL